MTDDEYNSDASLDTEDLNEINEMVSQPYEEVPVKSVERSKQTKKVPITKVAEENTTENTVEDTSEVKTKQVQKKELTDKQKANIANLVKLNKQRAEARKKARAEGKLLDEKPLGRKPKPKPPKEEIAFIPIIPFLN